MQSIVEMGSTNTKLKKKKTITFLLFCLPPTLISKVMKLRTNSSAANWFGWRSGNMFRICPACKTNPHPLNLPLTKKQTTKTMVTQNLQ